MSGTAWMIVLGFAALSAGVTLLSEFLNPARDRKVVSAPVISFIIAGVLNWGIMYFLMPTFQHPLTDGWVILSAVALITAIVIESAFALSSGVEHGAVVSITVTVVGFLVWLFVCWITPPRTSMWPICDTDGHRQMGSVIHITDAKKFPETDPQDVIRIPAEMAVSMVSSSLSSSGDANMSAYLQPDRAYRQMIRGHVYYVVNLKVTNWRAFRTAGGVIPGYFLVDASNPDATLEPRMGYKMKYAPEAQWGADLNRRVYFNFGLPARVRLDDLTGMEVSDDFQPVYAGTVLRPVVGYQGMKVTGMYLFDPETGNGEFKPLKDKPAWLDRVYSEEYVEDYLTWWGSWGGPHRPGENLHEACKWQPKLGQVKLDGRLNRVVTPQGVEYQASFTSMSADTAMTNLVLVSATTGEGINYPIVGGATLTKIEDDVLSAAGSLNAKAINRVSECQYHFIYGSPTVYCMLVTESGGGGEDDTGTTVSQGPYAFVGLHNSITGGQASVAVAFSFDDALFQYQTILASAGSRNAASLTNQREDVQVEGTVVRQVWTNTADKTGAWLIAIQPDGIRPSLLSTTNYVAATEEAGSQLVWIHATGTSQNAASAMVGEHVTATCYSDPAIKKALKVRRMTVRGVPDFDNTSR